MFTVIRTPAFERTLARFLRRHPDLRGRIAAVLHDALWRHAILPPSAMAAQPPMPPAVRFEVQACGIADSGAAPTGAVDALTGTEQRRRRYRRTPRTLGPRTYRTRPDPVAAVWDEVQADVAAQPARTATAAFQALPYRGCHSLLRQ